VFSVSTPAGDVLCSTDTEPAGLVRPDGGSTAGRVPPPAMGPGGACAHKMDTAAGTRIAKHPAGKRRRWNAVTVSIIYMHECI
jgi:hypothetical protein